MKVFNAAHIQVVETIWQNSFIFSHDEGKIGEIKHCGNGDATTMAVVAISNSFHERAVWKRRRERVWFVVLVRRND